MAKQKYENKRVISICGLLDKNEDGDYFITVSDKYDIETYDLEDILSAMQGNVISLSSDIM